MARTRIAIAGAGYIGLAHLAAAQQSGTVELLALVDPAQSAIDIAAKAGVPRYATLDALIQHAKPDGIVLATPNPLHLPHALQCMQAGIPILLEKPITPTVQEAEVLVRAVETQNATVLIGHHRAHSPIMAKAREVVQSGQLGKLVSVMGSALFLKPDHYFTDAPWRTQPGAGPILLNMIHEVHN
ncbi:MAG: Gfo/Idh/MocA family oxidoreductase, partial [Burkholderiaceae bacterium]